MRVRRLALVAVSTVLAGVSLAGCRSAPTVAAYVGDRKITVAEVDAIVRSVNDVAEQRLVARKQAYDARMDAIKAGKGPDEYPEVPVEAMLPIVHTSASQVLSLMVWGDVTDRILAERHLTTFGPPPFTDIFGLPASDEYVRLWLDYWPAFEAILQGSAQRVPSNDEAGRFYDALDEIGQVPDVVSYEQVIAGLKQNTQIGAAFQAQQALAEAVRTAHVTVNPRYGGLVMPVMLALQGGDTPIDVAFPSDSEVPVEEA
ncbi:hypothetical protein GCM10010399_28300 [Dactylosporangium fulvum]|uniref:SurA N-terminal domain-containing protein n=1 Tax=Dactylosporangium fulvum TaxID=53359 RepID=A0ABY5VY06_9ACTN|nr:SurA N-terminal domain-containing protein [Dactylosporangium fulvum]UWP81934.1 SurA N-terminal domain-containing protein [Dactylosporangium fulvum]